MLLESWYHHMLSHYSAESPPPSKGSHDSQSQSIVVVHLAGYRPADARFAEASVGTFDIVCASERHDQSAENGV